MSAGAPEFASPGTDSSMGTRCGRRFFNLLLSTWNYFYRRPGRSLLLLVIFVLTGSAIAAGGLWIWFDYHLRAARSELARGHNSEAIRHLRQCQRVRSEHREVLLLSARSARRVGSWDVAADLLDLYWQRYGDEPPLVFERLLHMGARGELEKVSASLQAYIQRGGLEASLARESLVTGLMYRFRWGEARIVIDEWLKESPDDTAALLQSGKFQEQLLGHDRAVETYRRALELDPDLLEARLRLATILVAHRRGDEAARELAVLRERLPDHAEVQVLWAQSLTLQGKTREARRALEDCLQSHPNYPSALLERGNSALFEGDEAQAEQDLALAAKLDPGNIQAHKQYAFVLNRIGKPAQASQEYELAKQLETDSERIRAIIRGPLQSNPNDAALHHEIGMIALRSGLVSEALRWFTSALQVNPDYLPTHEILVVFYRETDNPALASRHRAIAQKLSTLDANKRREK